MAFHNPQGIFSGGCANAAKIIEGARYSLLPLHFLAGRMMWFHANVLLRPRPRPYRKFAERKCYSLNHRRRTLHKGPPSLIRTAKVRAIHQRAAVVHPTAGME